MKQWEEENDKYIYFWGGIFSNWAHDNFEAKLKETAEDITFNCSEQYMMAQKALVFHDHGSLAEIMLSPDPAEQKALGRAITGYTDDKWDPVARDLTYVGVYAKFTQNLKWKEALLSTGDKIIVEASPYDKKWGIGLSTNVAIRTSGPSEWKGKNWLGQIIMKVRDDIRAGIDLSWTTIDWTKYENENLK